MSHFTCLVFGDNPAEQLAPFDENLEVEPYREPVSDKDIQSMLDCYRQGQVGNHKVEHVPDLEVGSEKFRQLWAGDWASTPIYQAEDGSWYTLSTYNPASKWDWWVVGGRWRGYLILKDGEEALAIGEAGAFGNDPEPAVLGQARADVARLGTIDWETMRLHKELRMREGYVEFEAALAQLTPGTPEYHRRVSRAQYEFGVRLRLREGAEHAYYKDAPERWEVEPLEEALASSRTSPYPLAAVKDRTWYERETMGWFGVSWDEKPIKEWEALVEGLIEEAGPETIVCVCDLHI